MGDHVWRTEPLSRDELQAFCMESLRANGGRELTALNIVNRAYNMRLVAWEARPTARQVALAIAEPCAAGDVARVRRSRNGYSVTYYRLAGGLSNG